MISVEKYSHNLIFIIIGHFFDSDQSIMSEINKEILHPGTTVNEIPVSVNQGF